MVGAVRDLLLSANHLIFSAKTRRQISLRCTSIRAQKKAPVLQALKGKSGKSLKGRKVPPKYRSPSGETWAGRGMKPKWMVAALKKGKKIESFLIKRPRS